MIARGEQTVMRHALRVGNARLLAILSGIVLALLDIGHPAVHADGVDSRVLEAQAKRIAVIERISPTVVAIFAQGGQGGGSGVLISKDGYTLTNFHVVQGSGPAMQCG